MRPENLFLGLGLQYSLSNGATVCHAQSKGTVFLKKNFLQENRIKNYTKYGTQIRKRKEKLF